MTSANESTESFEISRRKTQPSERPIGRASISHERDSGIVDQTVSAKSADAVQKLTGLQIAHGNRDEITNRSCVRRHCGIVVDCGPSDGRSDLDVG